MLLLQETIVKNYKIMKKYLLFILTMFCFTSVYAQWSTTHHEADQMKKMEAYDSYSYTNEVGDKFIFWSNSPKNFRIISSESIFNYNGNARWVNLEIGFYDENGNFIEKIVTNGRADNDEPSRLENMSFTKGAKKIISYIKEQKGSVRFLAPLYGVSSGFDFTIPCMKNKGSH